MRDFLTRILILGWLFLAGCQHPPSDLEIVVIPKGMTHEFWQSIHRGAQQAARNLEQQTGKPFRVLWDGPLRERDALAQIRIIDRRISTRVAGIVLAPQHSETMIPPVMRAVHQGIPVVIIDSGLNQPELTVKYVATDNRNGGRLAARHLLQLLRDAGKTAPRMALFRYAVGSESTEQREKGFEEVIDAEIARQKAAGEPTIEWVSRDKYAGATKDSALREALPMLNQLRAADGSLKIDGIFAVNESAASGMLDALRSLDLLGKVRVAGFDSSQPLLQALDDGSLDALILQDPFRMGYLGYWTVAQWLLGNEVVTSPDPHYLSTGEYVITRANAHEGSTRDLFEPERQLQRVIALPPVRKRTP